MQLLQTQACVDGQQLVAQPKEKLHVRACLLAEAVVAFCSCCCPLETSESSFAAPLWVGRRPCSVFRSASAAEKEHRLLCSRALQHSDRPECCMDIKGVPWELRELVEPLWLDPSIVSGGKHAFSCRCVRCYAHIALQGQRRRSRGSMGTGLVSSLPLQLS